MQLGDKFKIKAVARKKRVHLNGKESPIKPDYFAVRSEWDGRGTTWTLWTREKLSDPIEGIYIGWRNVRDGVVEYEGMEIGNVFYQKRVHRAWLFVISEHRNPIYVFPEDTVPHD